MNVIIIGGIEVNILENQILEANRLKKIVRDFKIEIQDRIILSDDITENERILQEDDE